MRPIYCTKYGDRIQETDLKGLFSPYGEIGCIIIKPGSVLCVGDVIVAEGDKQPDCVFSLTPMLITLRVGFSFVCFKDEHNAEVAIEGLNNKKYGENILRVIWAKGSVSGLNRRPTKTLLVSSLNSRRIGKYDIERHFEKYGEVDNVRMNRKSALVRFKTQGNATKALKSAHMSTIHRRVIFVEYALKDDDDTGGRYDRPRGDYGRRNGASCRSPSTEHRHRRLSPDHGRARSPDYDSRTYSRDKSPHRVRYRSRSPERRYHGTVSPDRGRDRSPDHNRPSNERVRSSDRLRDRSRSPVRRHHGTVSPDRGRDRSPDHNRPSNERVRSPDRLRDRSRSPVRRHHGTVSPDRGRDRSPDHNRPSNERVRSPDRLRDRSRSPERRYHGTVSPDRGRDRSPDQRVRSPDRLRDRSRSPVRRHQGPSYPRGRSRLSPDRRRDRSPLYKRRSNERARSPERLRDRRRSPVRRRSRRD